MYAYRWNKWFKIKKKTNKKLPAVLAADSAAFLNSSPAASTLSPAKERDIKRDFNNEKSNKAPQNLHNNYLLVWEKILQSRKKSDVLVLDKFVSVIPAMFPASWTSSFTDSAALFTPSFISLAFSAKKVGYQITVL